MNTTVVIVSYKSEQLVIRNIKKFDKKIKIIVIENSEDEILKKNIEQKFQNIEVILNKNKGFGQAANLGAKLANTKYILFCSPDNFLENNCFDEIDKIINKLNDNFSLLILSNHKEINNSINRINNVEGISCFLVKRKNFLDISGFDENFFLYYEDLDLVKRLLNNKNIIYKIPVKYISEGGSHNKKYNYPIEVNRNWHYMWSKFYYTKKHKGYIFSLIITFPYLLRSLFKVIFYFNNSNKRNIYNARLNGLLNAYKLKKSWFRPNLNIK